MTKSKQIGTWTESAVVEYLKANGSPEAKREVLHGSKDEGDVRVNSWVVLEVKGGHAAETASDAQIAAWLEEAEVERVHAGAAFSALVRKRKGKGRDNAGAWYVHLNMGDIARMRGYDFPVELDAVVTMSLESYAAQLRAVFGDGKIWS